MIQRSQQIHLFQATNMKKQKRQGFSLLETVIYIGLLAIVLPVFVGFLIGVLGKYDSLDSRIRMEQRASLILSQLSYEITSAKSINITNSTLASDNSSIVFVDDNSETVTIDYTEEVIDFSGTPQTIGRIRLVRGVDEPVWLTDEDIDVTSWNIDVARDSSLNLTGLSFGLTIKMTESAEDVLRASSFEANTAISLQPQTTEL